MKSFKAHATKRIIAWVDVDEDVRDDARAIVEITVEDQSPDDLPSEISQALEEFFTMEWERCWEEWDEVSQAWSDIVKLALTQVDWKKVANHLVPGSV